MVTVVHVSMVTVVHVSMVTVLYVSMVTAVVGYGAGHDDIIIKGDLEGMKFIAYYTK